MERALVLAGGGISGIAWESGVLAGLEAGGFETTRWDLVVGTSAGAYVGARLATDDGPGPLYDAELSCDDDAYGAELRLLFRPGLMRVARLSRRRSLRWLGVIWLATFVVTTLMRHANRRGWRSTFRLVDTVRRRSATEDPQAFLAAIGALADTMRSSPIPLIDHWEHALGAGRSWPSTRLIATAIDTQDGSRMLFNSSSGVSLAAAVAASTCLPALLPPIRLQGRRYMDGGIASASNADVATGHREVLIVSPGGGDVLEREIAALRSGGSQVHLVRPSPTSERLLPGDLRSFDPACRVAAARAGYTDGLAAAADLGAVESTRH